MLNAPLRNKIQYPGFDALPLPPAKDLVRPGGKEGGRRKLIGQGEDVIKYLSRAPEYRVLLAKGKAQEMTPLTPR